MVKVANLSADLTANTSSFDANLTRSRATLQRTGRQMSRSAENFNKKVSLSFRNAAQSVAAFDGPLGPIAGRLSTLGSIAGNTGVILGTTAVAVTGLTLALSKAAKVGDDFEGRLNQINALLKSTGNASGQTAEDIRAFAQELARSTLASVEGVEQAAITLLSFRRISGDTFKQAIVAAQDLSATFGTDLKSSILQIGKALEDPVLGITALSRSGVTFNQTQKEVIKTLTETGQRAEAQRLILEELQRTVGGAGAAQGGGLAKSFDSLAQSADNFFLALNDRLGASSFFAAFIKQIDQDLQALTTALSGEEPPLVTKLNEAFEQLQFLTAGATEEIQRLKAEGKTAEEASQYVQGEIEAQYELIDALNEALLAEKMTAAEKARTAQATQAKIAADEAEARAAEERQKLAEQQAKAEQRRQEQIATTIENLRQAVAAMELENDLLMSNTISIEEATVAREAMVLQQRLGLEVGSKEAKQLEELIEKRNALKDSIQKETAARARAKQIIKENKAEVEKLNDELKELEELRRRGLLTEEEYQKAVERTKKKIEELDESQKLLKETLDEVGEAAKASFGEFIKGTKSAGEALREFGLRILEFISDQAMEQLFKMIGTIFSDQGGIGGGTGGGSFLDGVISGIGSLFGGQFADGGRPPLGRVSLVGERGPELFVPDSSGTIVPNDALSGMGGVTVYADMRGASVEAVARLEAYIDQVNGSIEPRSINAVVTEKQRNPALFSVD